MGRKERVRGDPAPGSLSRALAFQQTKIEQNKWKLSVGDLSAPDDPMNMRIKKGTCFRGEKNLVVKIILCKYH